MTTYYRCDKTPDVVEALWAGDACPQCRPVAVIDPEDREAARRLLETYGRQFSCWSPELDNNVSRLQAALREFASPTPTIEEPTNVYAVVRDKAGREWCHVGGRVWRSLTSSGRFMVEKHWDDNISPLAGNVATVLSEGVTP